MAFLARVTAALVLVAGCYSPDLRDCTVSCASSADCAGAQVCSSNHFCAARGMTCAGGPPIDAHIATGDAPTDARDGIHDAAVPVDARPPVDAAPPIDAAPPTVQLHLHVDGHGAIFLGTFSCTADCNYQVIVGVPLSVTAVAGNNQRFDRWTQGPCLSSQNTSCSFTPTMPLTVAARFKKDD